MGFAAHTKTATYQKISVRLRVNRFFRSLIETFSEREKRTYLKKCQKMPLSRHYKSGNSPLGSETSIHDQGTQNLEPKYAHMMFVFVTSVGGTPLFKGHLPRVSRFPLNRGCIVCVFDRTYPEDAP